MSQQYVPNLGELPGEDARRDAVHIAVAPVVALHSIAPGDKVFLRDGRAVSWMEGDMPAIGIVDPFLTDTVKPGQRFWLFLFPNTVTSLRHVWSHPAFQVKLPATTPVEGGDA